MEFEKIITKIITKLKTINPERIILFGSKVNEKDRVDSDIDICIVKKEVKNPLKEKKVIRDLISDINFPIDIILVDEEKYDFYRNENCSVFKDIEKKGRVLWKK